MFKYNDTIEAVSLDKENGIIEYDNYDNYDGSTESLKRIINDYLANSYDLNFAYNNLNIFFGDTGIDNNIYLSQNKIYYQTSKMECLKIDNEPIIFCSYSYEIQKNGDILISFEEKCEGDRELSIVDNIKNLKPIFSYKIDDDEIKILFDSINFKIEALNIDTYTNSPLSIVENYIDNQNYFYIRGILQENSNEFLEYQKAINELKIILENLK